MHAPGSVAATRESKGWWEGGCAWLAPPCPARTPASTIPSKAPTRPRLAGHLLDVFGALVVDEEDNGIDVHVVQPLDGVGGDVQETVPVLRGEGGRGSAWGQAGVGGAGPQKHGQPSEDISRLSLPLLGPTSPILLSLASQTNTKVLHEPSSMTSLPRRPHRKNDGKLYPRKSLPTSCQL